MKLLVIILFVVVFGSSTHGGQGARALREAKSLAQKVKNQYKQSQKKVDAAREIAKHNSLKAMKVAGALARSSSTGIYQQIVAAPCPSKKPRCCLRDSLWLPQRKFDLSFPSSCARVKTFFCDGTSPEDYVKKMGGKVSTTGTFGDCGAGTRDMCPVVATVDHTVTCTSMGCSRSLLGCKGADCNIGRHIGLVVKYACTGQRSPHCGTVANSKGKVWVKEGDKTPWRPLKKGEEVPFRARIKTGRRSSLVLNTASGTIITMGSRSDMNLTNLGTCQKNQPRKNSTIVQGLYGTFRMFVARVGKRTGPIQFISPNSVLGVRGTKFSVDIEEKGGQRVVTHKVTRGKVEILDRFTGKRTFLKAGRSLVISAKKGQKPTYDSTTFKGVASQIKGKPHLRK